MIQKNYVGKDIANYNGMLVLSHFKGHPMGGYGGALKQLSIGCASSYGKAYIHGAGVPEDICVHAVQLCDECDARVRQRYVRKQLLDIYRKTHDIRRCSACHRYSAP